MWIGYDGLGTSAVSPGPSSTHIRCENPSLAPMVTHACGLGVELDAEPAPVEVGDREAQASGRPGSSSSGGCAGSAPPRPASRPRSAATGCPGCRTRGRSRPRRRAGLPSSARRSRRRRTAGARGCGGTPCGSRYQSPSGAPVALAACAHRPRHGDDRRRCCSTSAASSSSPPPSRSSAALERAEIPVDRDRARPRALRGRGVVAGRRRRRRAADRRLLARVPHRVRRRVRRARRPRPTRRSSTSPSEFATDGLWMRVDRRARSTRSARSTAAGIRLGVVSNAGGTMADRLRELEVLQVGAGLGVEVEHAHRLRRGRRREAGPADLPPRARGARRRSGAHRLRRRHAALRRRRARGAPACGRSSWTRTAAAPHGVREGDVARRRPLRAQAVRR